MVEAEQQNDALFVVAICLDFVLLGEVSLWMNVWRVIVWVVSIWVGGRAPYL